MMCRYSEQVLGQLFTSFEMDVWLLWFICKRKKKTILVQKPEFKLKESLVFIQNNYCFLTKGL